MTGTLFGQLERAGLQIDLLNVADAIWLARFVPGDAAFTPHTEERADVRKTDAGPAPGSSPQSDSQKTPPPTEPETRREPAPETKPDPHIYAELGNLSGSRTVPASPIRVPATTALPGFLDLSRALRPLNARRPSARFFELDEGETVEQAARHDNLLMPMFRPRPERWFNAALVVEQSPSMDVWGQAVAEFNKLLERQGAFSDVRMWRFHLDDRGGNLVGESGAARPPETLIDPSGRRLIFFVTNGLSPAWRSGEFGRMLAAWGRSSPVVVVHALPSELWKRTVLGEARATAWSLKAGRPNQTLSWSTELTLDPRDSRFLVPVMHWTPEAFGSWARMFMARGRVTSPAFLVRTVKPPERRRPSQLQVPRAIDPATRLSALDHSSEKAQELAAHMAAAPLTLPVIRLVQAALFGEQASPSQIAEVMLSGLVERITPSMPPVHPDTVQYRFAPDVRPLLLERLRKSSARSIVELLTPYIRDHQGNLVDFRALVRDAKGRFELPESTQPFAELAVGLMSSLGLMPAPQPAPEPQQLPAAQVFRAHTEVVNKVAITQDGRFAASASSDGTIRIWDLASGLELGMEQFERPVTSLAISFDGQRIACAYGNMLVHRSGFGGTPVVRSEYGADGSFDVTAVAIDATGNTVFAGFGDGTVRTWDLEHQGVDVLCVLPSTIVDVSATRDGRRIVAASAHSVRVFVDREQVQQISFPTTDVCALWIDPHNGQRIAVLDKTGAVSFYAVSTGALIYSILGISTAFAITPDGRFLAGVRGLNEIVLWDVNEHRPLHSLAGHQYAVTSLAISADGSTIVSGGWDKTVRVWRVPVDLPSGGRIALIARENTPGETVWMVNMLADAGHVVRYARWETEAPEAVEQSEAVIFVDLAGRQPTKLYLRLSFQYSGKPLLEFYDRQPTQVELLEGAARLIAEARAGGPLQGLPDLPDRYFPRPELETRLADALIDPEGSIVVVLQGAGRGILLSAVARSAKVRRHFSGGIIWGATVPPFPEINGPRLWCAPAITPREFRSQDRCAALEPANFPQQPVSIFEVPPLTRAECSQFLSQGTPSREMPNYDLVYDIHEANWPVLARIDALSDVCEPSVLVKMLADSSSMLLASPVEARPDLMLDPAWHALRLENHNFLRLLFVCRTTYIPSVIARFFEKQFPQISVGALATAGYLIRVPDGSLHLRILQATARAEAIAEPGFHRQVVEAYSEARHGLPPHLGTNDGYYFENLIYHMMSAQMDDEAAALAQSPEWQEEVTMLLGAPAAESQLASATRSPAASKSGSPTFWILVVGTGRQSISQPEVFASEVLGAQIARSGYGLISGGWKGVDHVVAREFAKQRRQQGNEVDLALMQILAPRQAPDFPEGTRVYAPQRGVEEREAVQRCDAVIMIGGLGGTYNAYRWAVEASKPVFPLAGTGGDAKRAFDEMVTRGALPEDDTLVMPITSYDDARRTIEVVFDRLSGSTNELGGVQRLLDPADSDPLDSLRVKALEYLDQQGLSDSDRVAAQLRTMCARVRKQLKSVPVLIDSDNVEDRVVGYLCFQISPQAVLVRPLVAALDFEIRFIEGTHETRPLWQLLVCFTQVMTIDGLDGEIGPGSIDALEKLSVFLNAKPSIDRGNECKSRLELLERLAALILLAHEYDSIRLTQQSSDTRTRNMTDVVQRMQPVVRKVSAEYVLPSLASPKGGRRLSAYLFLYLSPNVERVADLVDSITRIENTRFGQYWGLMALSVQFPKGRPTNVSEQVFLRLTAMLQNLKPGIDRHVLLTRIIANLTYRREV